MISPAVQLLEDVLSPLRPWMSDHETEDIAIQGPGKAWVYQSGGWSPHDVDIDLDALEEIPKLAASFRQQDLGLILDTYLPTRERLNACLPPTVEAGSISLTIRRPSSKLPLFSEVNERYRTANWHEWRPDARAQNDAELLPIFDSGDFEAFLRAAVRHRLGIIMAGETGSGKTTFSNMLATEIDGSERVITIEDALEFVVPQPNNVRLLYSQDDSTGIGLGQLIKAGLRQRPGRLIIQEIREPEAAWLFVHHSPAHRGSITTIHGDDAPSAARRLYGYCKGSEVGGRYDAPELIQALSDAVDVIVPLRRVGKEVAIGSVWYAGDRRRDDEGFADLVRGV
jgi:type IV secretion system protein VirB11